MIGTVKVYSLRRNAPKPGYSEMWFVVDRTTSMGNPFEMKRESERDSVCDLHAQLLQEDWEQNGPRRRWIERVAGRAAKGINIALMCWCAPKRCHADDIATRIRQAAEKLCQKTTT